MDQSVPTTDRSATLPARDLHPGQHITALDRFRVEGHQFNTGEVVAEVRYSLPFTDGDGVPRVAVMATRCTSGQPWELRFLADEPVTLASSEQVAEAGAVSRREAVAARMRAAADELHRLADDVVRRRLPVPGYSSALTVELSVGVVDSPDDLERWAEYLGASVEHNGSNDIPSVRASRGRLEVRAQAGADPSIEMLDPVAWSVRDGVTVVDRDGWSDGKPWLDRIWRPEWLRRMSASTVQQRTVAPVEPGVVTVDGAAMAEAVAVVNDQVAATPPDAVEYGQEPRHPAGTPEHKAYAAELRTELGKFARGESPYDKPAAEDTPDEDQGAEPAGCRGCGKVGKVAAHRPGCSVVAAWDAHRAGDHSMCLAGGVVCAVLERREAGSDGDQ